MVKGARLNAAKKLYKFLSADERTSDGSGYNMGKIMIFYREVFPAQNQAI
jgi:hypothetical protein